MQGVFFVTSAFELTSDCDVNDNDSRGLESWINPRNCSLCGLIGKT